MDISPLSTMTPVDQTRAIQQWMQDVEDGFVRNDGAEPARKFWIRNVFSKNSHLFLFIFS